MAFLSVSNVRIKGISACVPAKVEENRELKKSEMRDKRTVFASSHANSEAV